jgi:HAD superfamily hydrolase (TIGR01459 family)
VRIAGARETGVLPAAPAWHKGTMTADHGAHDGAERRPGILAGLAACAPDYDGFILDLWGVLHDGVAPFPGALSCLERLIAAGKRIVILSNAPRRAAAVIERMTEIGIPPGLYHHVMSSGEDTWQHLAHRPDAFYRALGSACLHIGPPRDSGMLEDLGLRVVADVAAADFLLNTGPWGWDRNAELYERLLQAARGRDLPMVCANPDLVVQYGGRLAICAGTLAQRYEALGGRVRWHGKPMREIYEICFGLLGLADRRRILAVGDSLRTDIAGASGAGIDGLFIAGGIHAEEFGHRAEAALDPEIVAPRLATAGARPRYVMARFAW